MPTASIGPLGSFIKWRERERERERKRERERHRERNAKV